MPPVALAVVSPPASAAPLYDEAPSELTPPDSAELPPVASAVAPPPAPAAPELPPVVSE
jgi:hypothetical protein